MKKAVRFICLFLAFITIFSSLAFAGITYAETPVTSEETELKWSLKLGTNYRNAPSVPAVCGNDVYIMSLKKLYKINAENGEILKTADMTSTPSFSYTPPLVENGTVFCPLEDGTVQAFDADTMQSLWIYSDPLGGQALSPIVCDNGLIYTGFWNDEEVEANYVCLNAANGSLVWSYTHKGGFYWSEPAVTNNHLILGCDNGSGNDNDAGTVLSINKFTGEITDSLEITGDQRSGISVYNGYFYFVTKAGYLYKTALDNSGKFVSLEQEKLSGASTSTPVIYNGKIYVGVQSSGFNGSLCVLNSETLEQITSVPMKGYPQSEILLTAAYDSEYIYSTYNSGPGGISVISCIDYSSADLFIPESEAQGYCISPVIATDNGTLIYKNDSGTVFAVGKKTVEEPQKSFFERIIDWFKSLFDLIISLFK